MPNFDPSKLQTLINNPNLTSQGVLNMLTLKRENEEKEKALQEERERNAKLEQEHADKLGLVTESQPVIARFALLENKYNKIVSSLKDVNLRQNLEQRVAEIKNELKNIPTNLTQDSLAELEIKLTNFDMLLAVAEAAIHPPTPEPLDVLGLWPSNINKRDDKQHKGWVYDDGKGKQENLPTGDWDKADANIKPVFAEYRTFMLEGDEKARALKVEMFKSLVEAKNNIVEALRAKDPIGARTLAEEFKVLLAEKKESWRKSVETFGRIQALEKKFKLLEATKEDLASGVQDHLKTLHASVEALLKKAYKTLADGGKVTSDDEEKISHKIDAYNERVTYYKENQWKPERPSETEKDAALNGIWVTNKDGTRALVGFLKDTPTDVSKMTKAEKNRMIKVIGRPAMRMEDYVNEQNAKKEAASKVIITDDIEDAWPELKAAGYTVGQTLEKNWLAKFQTKTTYERMFSRNQKDFLHRFTIPSLDPTTNTVRYTESKLLKAQGPLKEVIKEILASHGIIVDIQNEEERKAEDKKEGLEKQVWRKKNSVTFHPRLVKEKGVLSKGNDGYRFGGLTPEKMTKKTTETLVSSKERYEDLKRLREKYLNHVDDITHYRFIDKERKLDEGLVSATKEQERAGNNKNWSTRYKLWDFQKALDKYEKEVLPLIEKQKTERKLPATPEERQKRQEALKKIDEILKARDANIKKNKKLTIKSGKLWATLAVVVIAGATAYGFNKYMEEKETKSPEEPTPIVKTVEQKETLEDLVNNKELLKYMKKGPPSDEDVLREMALKFAPKSVDINNPASVEAFLNMNGWDILNIPQCYGLSESAQDEACRFIRGVEDISQKVNYHARLAKLRRFEGYDHPQDWYITPNVTIKDYFIKIRRKVAEAQP